MIRSNPGYSRVQFGVRNPKMTQLIPRNTGQRDRTVGRATKELLTDFKPRNAKVKAKPYKLDAVCDASSFWKCYATIASPYHYIKVAELCERP